MNRIDPNTLFSIFEASDEEVYKENGVQDLLKQHHVILGMVVRGMENYFLMDKLQLNSHGEEYKKVRTEVRHKYMGKLFKYLQRIPLDNIISLEKPAQSIGYRSTLTSLHNLIQYFESIEHYERCADIKRYLDLVIEPDPVKEMEVTLEDVKHILNK